MSRSRLRQPSSSTCRCCRAPKPTARISNRFPHRRANAGRAISTRIFIFCKKTICARNSREKTGTGQSSGLSSFFGEALKGNLNVLPAICVYAALRKEAGLPLSFPGGPPYVFEAVDADLLARSLAWAATSPNARNETFNSTNGDVFVWQNVWPTIADALGMEVGPPEPLCLTQEMPKHDADWAAIVDKYQLKAPRKMLDFVGGSFELTDLSFAYGASEPPPPIVVSTIKIRQAGFHECMDTEDMFRNLIKRYQDLRWIPPV